MTVWQTWRRAFRARPPRVRIWEGPRLEDIASLEALAEAWGRVRANKGGPGGDGVTIAALAPEIEVRLETLSQELLTERYRPHPIRRALMRKPSGGWRPLTIPAVIDRIAQTAALIALEPGIDERMSETNWGYRPKRGVAQAIAAVSAAYGAGFGWTIDADIEGYFDAIPHRHLATDLAIWIDDERILRLLLRWVRTFGRRGRGVAQGAPISPLFANIYLHPIDRLVVAAGFPMVRYADDFVVLARSGADARQALGHVARLLRDRGLALNRAKTRVVAPGEALTFLGGPLVSGACAGGAAPTPLESEAAGDEPPPIVLRDTVHA